MDRRLTFTNRRHNELRDRLEARVDELEVLLEEINKF